MLFKSQFIFEIYFTFAYLIIDGLQFNKQKQNTTFLSAEIFLIFFSLKLSYS